MMHDMQVNFVMGFLGSGKTSFIQKILPQGEGVVLMEEGSRTLDENFSKVDTKEDLFQTLIALHKKKVRRTWVEWNGTEPISSLLSQDLPPGCYFGNFYTVVNKAQLNLYSKALGDMYLEPIANSDGVIFTGGLGTKEEKKKLSKLSPGLKFYDVEKINEKEKQKLLENKESWTMGRPAFLTFTGFLLLMLFAIWIPSNTNAYLFKLYQINTIALGLILESLPFLLLGAFFSALASSFLSPGWLGKKVQGGGGYFISLFSGFFLPFCDCALPPMMGTLLGQGVHIRYALAFFLAAPLVNPITILSTYYAYLEYGMTVVYRLVFGLITVLVISEAIARLWKGPIVKEKNIFVYRSIYSNKAVDNSFPEKLKTMFYVGAKEFYRMASYLVIGAFVAGGIQVFFPFVFRGFGAYPAMIFAAVLLSLCANTNAFVGKSFGLPYMATLGYMILGPMLSFKNLLLLSHYVHKKFVLVLTFALILWGMLFFPFLAKVVGL